MRRESFPRIRSPPERTKSALLSVCICQNIAAPTSRASPYLSFLERAPSGRGGLSGRGRHGSFCHIPFPAFLSVARPPEGPSVKASSASVAPPPPRDGTRREQETRAIARKLGTYSTGAGRPHITARFSLSLRDRSPMSLIGMTIQSA